MRSLSDVKGLFLTPDSSEDLVQDDWGPELVKQVREMEVRALEISLEDAAPRQVVAIDTSSVIVAAGHRGVVAAVRGGLAIRNHFGVKIERIGPFIAYITHDNMAEVLASIPGRAISLDYCMMDYKLDGSIQKVLAGLLEKKLQEYIAEKYENSILLFDGSLSAGPLDNPLWLVSRILEKAAPKGNDILAFSKTSVLQFWSNILTDTALGVRPPYIVDMTWAIKKIEMWVKVLGDTYLAKLSGGANAFRLDVSTKRRVEEVLASLLRSDSLIHGYPELLVLAHDYCTFTKIDLIAIQSILRKRGIEFFEASSIRNMLFNPLDGEWKR